MKNQFGLFIIVVSFLAAVGVSGCGTIDCWTCRFDATVQPADTAVPTDAVSADAVTDVPATDAVPADAAPATDASSDAATADASADAAACTPGAVEWDCQSEFIPLCGIHSSSRACGPNEQWSVCLLDPRCLNRDGGTRTDASGDAVIPADAAADAPVADAAADVPATDATPVDAATVATTDEYVVMAATDGESANEVHLEQWIAAIGDTMPVGSHANVGDPGRTSPLIAHTTTFRINRCAEPQFQSRFVFAAVSPSRRQTTLWGCMRFDGRFEQYGPFSVRRNGTAVPYDAVDNGVRGCNFRPRRDPSCP